MLLFSLTYAACLGAHLVWAAPNTVCLPCELEQELDFCQEIRWGMIRTKGRDSLLVLGRLAE